MSKRIPFPYWYSVKPRADMQGGARGNHKWGMIDIRDDQGVGVLAEEIMEEDYLMVRCHIPNAIIGAALGAYVDGAFGAGIGVFAAVIFGYLLFRTVIGPITGWHRQMEYRGRMVSYVLGHRFLGDIVNDLAYYSQFEGLGPEDVNQGLLREYDWALAWAEANRDFVEAKATTLGLKDTEDYDG